MLWASMVATILASWTCLPPIGKSPINVTSWPVTAAVSSATAPAAAARKRSSVASERGTSACQWPTAASSSGVTTVPLTSTRSVISKQRSRATSGSGAVAQDQGVAAGEGGVAVGRDVHGAVGGEDLDGLDRREVVGGDQHRALREVQIERLFDPILDDAAVQHQIGDRTVAVAGRTFRGPHGAIDLGQPSEIALVQPAYRVDSRVEVVARHEVGDRDRAGVDHRVRCPVAVVVEGDRVEAVAPALRPWDQRTADTLPGRGRKRRASAVLHYRKSHGRTNPYDRAEYQFLRHE